MLWQNPVSSVFISLMVSVIQRMPNEENEISSRRCMGFSVDRYLHPCNGKDLKKCDDEFTGNRKKCH